MNPHEKAAVLIESLPWLERFHGATVVIKDSDQLEILATNKLNDPIDASPALTGTQLFLRSRDTLYCIGR